MRMKILAGLIGAALMLSPTISAYAAEVQGKMVDDRIYVPLRYAADQIKAQVSWDNKTKTATMTKDDKQLIAKVGGPFVKVFHGRVYVQFREVNDTFFGVEQVYWYPDSLSAGSDHMRVSLAPLTKDEAMHILYTAIAKANSITNVKQKREYLQPHFTDKAINTIIEKKGFNQSPRPLTKEDVSWMKYTNFTSLQISWSVEYGDLAEYFLARVHASLIKKGDRWIVDDLKYEHGEIMPPH
ncbi:copper amine oxidase N-terminal domain-containing protein [Cohnella suwonensis]|uniref:Copper amine oxidase N-terminal domain-containing protein n=1 Tax=Cohnella suwonensis TaxID=696072 RepID=A0ABW0M0Q5_9BACL